MTLPISAVSGLKSLLGVGVAGGGAFAIFPAGIIFPYGGDTAPDGTLMCDGAAYVITTKQRLFDAIGHKYAVGRPAPPAGSFYVPDYRDRTIYGVGSAPLTNAPGKNDGVAAASRTGPAHHHHFNRGVSVGGGTDTQGDHNHQYVTTVVHSITSGTAGPVVNVMDSYQAGAVTTNAGGHSHGVSASGTVDGDTTGGGQQDSSNFGTANFVIIA